MNLNDIKIPKSTLAELRGVLVRALSRENLSVSDKMAIRKSQSSSSLKINYAWSSNCGGKKEILILDASENVQCLFRCVPTQLDDFKACC